MNLHKHARLSPRGRALLVRRVVDEGLRVEEAAHAAGVSVLTAYKWLRRFREEGTEGLGDRSSRPTRCLHATPPAVVAQLIERRLARQTYHQSRGAGRGAKHDCQAAATCRAASAGGAGPARPDNRYEHGAPGDMLHLDIKKLGRFWRPGHRVSRRFRRLIRRLGLRHQRTRPYTPRTNGKAERLVQTALREWAYARSYESSVQRAEVFPRWLHHYNWHRPHASVGYQPSVSRLSLPLNNVLGLHN